MILRKAIFAPLFLFSLAQAGEIVIVQPAGNETRNERNLGRTLDKARQNSGKQAAPLIVEEGVLDRGSNAERSSRDAQEYLRPAASQHPGHENTTIILRNAPLTDAEKARQKAAVFAQPAGASAVNRACGDVSLSVGMIGDEAVIQRNASVNQRGNSVVDTSCRK